jgi:hypothetical protein
MLSIKAGNDTESTGNTGTGSLGTDTTSAVLSSSGALPIRSEDGVQAIISMKAQRIDMTTVFFFTRAKVRKKLVNSE